jgi:DNA-binding LacI/PurR family transcriptional regulator
MVTMADIAKRAGVSQPTVSRVLNGKGATARISAATQKRVKAIARRLQFRPSFAGQALVRGRTRSIGFMCGNIRNPHYTEMADIAMQMVEQHGYHLNYPAPKLSCMRFDAQPGMNEAFALLKANGHSRIASIRLDDSTKRLPFLAAARQYGLEVEEYPTPVSDHPQRDEELLSVVRQEAHRFAERKDRPGAAIVSSDYVAGAFIGGLWDKGVMVPRDVSVIGFDGTQAGGTMTPPLTSIGPDATEIIRLALEIIFDGMEQRKWSDSVVTVPTRLVVRNSVGANHSQS